MSTATHKPMTPEQYHQSPAIGSSMMGDFRRSRRLFHGLHVAKIIPHKPPSDAMIFGTQLHMAILEPDRFDKTYVVPPETASDGRKWNRTFKLHKTEWAEWEAANVGKECLEPACMEQLKAMREAVMANAKCRELLKGAHAEYPVFWTDDESGVECKILIDIWRPDLLVLLDLKTTPDPSPSEFARACAKWKLYRQAAHYKRGAALLMGDDVDQMLIAAGKEPPHQIGVYQLSQRALVKGDDDNRRTLAEIAECQATGNWGDWWEGDVMDLDLSDWEMKDDPYAIGV